MTKIPCAIMLDTKGPEIRTGMLLNHEPVILESGSRVKLHCGEPSHDFTGDDHNIGVDYANLPKVVSPGSVIKVCFFIFWVFTHPFWKSKHK